jgi:hypothetical protein
VHVHIADLVLQNKQQQSAMMLAEGGGHTEVARRLNQAAYELQFLVMMQLNANCAQRWGAGREGDR